MSMLCHDVQDRLSGYLDDELSTDALVDVRTHIVDCGDCSERRDALSRVDDLIGASLSDHPFGDAAVETILGKLDLTQLRPAAPATTTTAPARAPRWLIGGLSVAAAALLVSLSLSLLQREQLPQEGLTAQAPSSVEVGEAGAGLMRLDGDQSPVLRQTRLKTGQKLLAVGNPASIYLDDGTVLELHADTEVELRHDADGGLTVHVLGHEGKVYCEVSKQVRPFRVQARGLKVQVLGTRFVVEQQSRSSSVTVIEGRVRAESAGDKQILTAEDKAQVFSGQSTLIRSRVTPRHAVLWVPRVRAEQSELDQVRVRKTEQATTPTHRPTQPTKPTAPVKPEDLDQPLLPPKRKTR